MDQIDLHSFIQNLQISSVVKCSRPNTYSEVCYLRKVSPSPYTQRGSLKQWSKVQYDDNVHYQFTAEILIHWCGQKHCSSALQCSALT